MRKFILSAVILFGLTVAAKAAVVSLECDVTGTGWCQGGVVTFLGNVRDTVNELVDDHASFITLASANKAAINDIIANMSAFYAAVDADMADVTNASSDYNSRFGSGGSDDDPLAGVVTDSPPATLSDTTDLTLSK